MFANFVGFNPSRPQKLGLIDPVFAEASLSPPAPQIVTHTSAVNV